MSEGKDAEIERLTAENNRNFIDAGIAQAKLVTAEARIAEMEKALEFYADEDTWIDGKAYIHGIIFGDEFTPALDDIREDNGETARLARQGAKP